MTPHRKPSDTMFSQFAAIMGEPDSHKTTQGTELSDSVMDKNAWAMSDGRVHSDRGAGLKNTVEGSEGGRNVTFEWNASTAKEQYKLTMKFHEAAPDTVTLTYNSAADVFAGLASDGQIPMPGSAQYDEGQYFPACLLRVCR